MDSIPLSKGRKHYTEKEEKESKGIHNPPRKCNATGTLSPIPLLGKQQQSKNASNASPSVPISQKHPQAKNAFEEKHLSTSFSPFSPYLTPDLTPEFSSQSTRLRP